ncbi:glutamate--putrescine ligase [Cognatiyoonia sediminum]|uniref:Glutamate--putrescine ligase n=1 Tax=Cognatiyoonia sediminum TaxID=1508389 RepID=A0A1M5L3V9_9RHOB|nr:glutamine synthetase family protein [Cognatiyoonia sediminum]SHG59620.1 glutamate--putrescine ligase [Cognatiyoonia sediminum]
MMARTFQCGAADLNGQLRGKRLPVEMASKVEKNGIRFPLSVFNLDIWGEDIDDSPLVFESGDADGKILPTERGPLPLPWLSEPTKLIPLWGFNEDGSPFAGCPRQALKSVVDRLASHGFTPVAANEMEFYLTDDSGPLKPIASEPGGQIMSLRALDRLDPFFAELYESCAALGIAAEATTSESGTGQFEVTIQHSADALKAADDAWFFKLLVQGLARKHGMAGTFMAKPFAEDAGNGMHSHVSLLDAKGSNVFADGSATGTVLLENAVAGCLTALQDLTLIFAPHANSYARMVPGAHAPTGICWGHDNRTVAVRIPGGDPAAKRVEHRLAGGDVNPYLSLAAILGSMLIGIEESLTPPAPVSGNAYYQDLDQVHEDWGKAIDVFEQSGTVAKIFDPKLISYFSATKRQEVRRMTSLSDQDQLRSYLDRV